LTEKQRVNRENKIEYCVEPKFDGASISLIYENDLLVRGATRGDGVEGDEITTNIKQIKSIPLSAKFSEYGLASSEIRGEVLINKNNFKKYNEQLMEQGLPPWQIHEMLQRNITNKRSERSWKEKLSKRLCIISVILQHFAVKKQPLSLINIRGHLKCFGNLVFAARKKKKKC
jgi:hypothetical protein